jgi:hypothetical protein
MKKFIAFSLFLVASNTYAAQHRVENETLYFEGDFTVPEVRTAIESAPFVRRLSISSRGGDLLAGILLANWVLERQLDVEVKEICASSCANYVLPAARRKVITEGALLIWHGGAYQNNFVDFVKSYEQALWRSETEQPQPQDKRTLQASNKYQIMKLQQAVEDEFYARSGVNKKLPIAGLPLGAWTLTGAAMERFGVRDLILPPSYGTQPYIDSWLTKRYPDPAKRIPVALLE